MSKFVTTLKSLWMKQGQRVHAQKTRGIMSPEERDRLAEEFDDLLREHERQVAERVWDFGVAAGHREAESNTAERNPFRKEEEI